MNITKKGNIKLNVKEFCKKLEGRCDLCPLLCTVCYEEINRTDEKCIANVKKGKIKIIVDLKVL